MERQNFENKKINAAVLEGIQILCRIFWGPDTDSCRHMMQKNIFEPFEIIFAHLEIEPSDILNNINLIINSFDTHPSFFDHLNECYVRLFVNSKEGIYTPLYESCYEFKDAPMMGAAAVKMKQRFKSKGLSMEKIVHEPPDHLAVELEYLFFLLQEENGMISSESVSFIRETMLPWISVLDYRLTSVSDECRFYSLSSSLLVLFLELICTKRK